mgnify:CR=1 FL=1
MSEDEVTDTKTGFSMVTLAVVALLTLLVGYGAGTFTGDVLLGAIGFGEEKTLAEESEESEESAASALFQPMDGVFDPKKKRFYAEVGELLIAMPYRGATRHLQLTVQLVGHDQKYMKSVMNDVPAIRNGLLIFLNQKTFEQVNTYEGRESLRLETLQRVNEIINATDTQRVADVYFTAYITQ